MASLGDYIRVWASHLFAMWKDGSARCLPIVIVFLAWIPVGRWADSIAVVAYADGFDDTILIEDDLGEVEIYYLIVIEGA